MTDIKNEKPIKPVQGVVTPALSMTGYGSAQSSADGWLVSVEIRSVNSRFLDLTFKVPDEHRALEAVLREMVQAKIARGKVECRVQMRRSETAQQAQINFPAVDAFKQQYGQLKALIPELAQPALRDLLEWPGVRGGMEAEPEAIRALVVDLSRQALTQMLQARQREGEALAAVLADRARQMLEIAAHLRVRLPQVLQDQQTRITERLETALGLVADRNGALISAEEVRARIAQEVVMIGTRIDVAEELDRLVVHCKEVINLLASGKPAGKRLDFVVQELNREANTLGSKMVAEDFSRAAVELKVLIEQMREQVQNLE